MDILIYITPIIKWWRLILIAALIAGLSTFFALLGQPRLYESHSTLMIGQSINNPNPSSNSFYLEQELAKIYADRGGREPIRRSTMEALGLNSLPPYVVTALPNSQLIEINVRDTSPTRAQAVAAELANQLILSTPTEGDLAAREREDFINEQIDLLTEDITATQAEISQLEIEFGDLQGAREIADVERQISALEDKLRTLQSTYATLVTSTARGAANSLTVIEPAEIPTRSSNPSRLLSIVLAAALGAGVASAGAYVIEYLDRRVNSTREAVRILGWPAITEIEEIPSDVDVSTIVLDEPYSSIANSFRTLKTNLDLAGLGAQIRTVLIIGGAVSEGKSTIASNLAQTLAQGGGRVVLVEGDFHGPNLQYPDRKGLSDLILEGGYSTEYLFSPGQDNLFVLPAGQDPKAATNMLNRKILREIFEGLKDVAETIVIDGPPAFVSDALTYAGNVDGVIVVVKLGKTRIDAINHLKTQFEAMGVVPLGIAVNGLRRMPVYYGRYYMEISGQERTSGFQKFLDRSLEKFKAWRPSLRKRDSKKKKKNTQPAPDNP